jgi:hypothetical protein
MILKFTGGFVIAFYVALLVGIVLYSIREWRREQKHREQND